MRGNSDDSKRKTDLVTLPRVDVVVSVPLQLDEHHVAELVGAVPAVLQ